MPPDQHAETGGVINTGTARDIITGYTIEQYEAALERQEQRIRIDLERAHAAEKALLQQALDEVRRRTVDLELSFEARRRVLAASEEALWDLSGGMPQAKLDAAHAALARGDTGVADALFQQVEEMDAPSVARAATAAFERGRLAESDLRWVDAAAHYVKAARLAPTYAHLLKAQDWARRIGEHSFDDTREAILRTAETFGEALIRVALKEYGQVTADRAKALSERATTALLSGTPRRGRAALP